MEQYSYSEGDASWYDTFLARVEKQSKGTIPLSLTNYLTSTVCAIAAGSVVEINGAMFVASANESISGSIASGLNYIICSVTGTTAAPYWSQTIASTYDIAKQGYYHGNERYVGGINSVAGVTYDEKWVYHQSRNLKGLSGRLKDLVLGGLGIKIWNSARGAAGDQEITGVGFESSIICFLAVDATGANLNWSVGFDDGDISMLIYQGENGTVVDEITTRSIYIYRDAENYLRGQVSAKGGDGFTITWELAGACSLSFIYICLP